MSGRTALVTGVSRRAGIAFAVARRLLDAGDRVVVSSWSPHDAEQPLGQRRHRRAPRRAREPAAPAGRPGRPGRTRRAGRARPRRDRPADHPGRHPRPQRRGRPGGGHRRRTGRLLRRQRAGLGAAHPAEGPRCPPALAGSGRAPAAGPPCAVAYALSKAAIQGITATLAGALAERAIAVTCLNPGPVDTGWADDDVRGFVARRFPSGRWTTPEETAAVVDWLTGPDGMLLTGQTVNAEAGFRL